MLCVEVVDARGDAPRRVWQLGAFGKDSLTFESFLVSDAVNRRFVVVGLHTHVYAPYWFFAALVPLDGEVEPLPLDYDPKTDLPKWKLSPWLPIPEDGRPLGVREFGFKLRHPDHELSLQSVTKIETGWRIDGTVFGPLKSSAADIDAGRYGRDPILRFAVFLDEECKSAKIEVLK